MPERPEKVGSFRSFDDVLRKLTYIEVEADEVVDILDFAGSELGLDLPVTLAPGDHLAPDLGRQGILSGRRLVPPPAQFQSLDGPLADRLMQCGQVDAYGDIRRKRPPGPVTDAGVDVSI